MKDKMSEAAYKALDKFMIPCCHCLAGLMVATLERFGDSLVFKCLECDESVISGKDGILIDAYAEMRKEKGQTCCCHPGCDRSGEATKLIMGPVCWKHR